MAILLCSVRNLYLCLLLSMTIITFSNGDNSEKSNREEQKDNFDHNLYKSFYTSDHRKISVYNDFLLPSNVYLLRRYLSDAGRWEHTLKDYNNGSDFRDDSPDHILWKSFLDPEFIEKSKIGRKVLRAVQHFKGDQASDNYHMYNVAAKLVVRSEVPKGSIDAPADDNDISAILYLITKWKKNDYGDILFYEKNKEIVCGVHPLMFRMVMFDSSIEHLYKPPSIDSNGPVRTIHIKLTKSSDKLKKAIEDYKARSQHRVDARNKKLNDIAPLSQPRTIDVEKHITRQYVAQSGKKIYVLDNVFTPQELQGLRRIIEYKEYVHQSYLDKGSDGVSWLASFSLQDFVDSNLWKIHQQVVRYVGSRDTYFPYDVSCNMIKNTDNTRVHDDCSQTADQWTMVTYLNPNWTAQMGGETAYFEKNTDDNDYVIEVRPRYGRSVIFQSTIYHSARPPSNDFDGLRYSFSVKMAEDEPQARLNRLSEDYAIYAGNVDQYDYIKRIAHKLGSKKLEKSTLSMLLDEDELITDNGFHINEEQNQDAIGEGNDQRSQESNTNNQNKAAKDEEFESLAEAYRHPHRSLPEIENKAGAKERLKLIKTIEKHRYNGDKMAKLQNSIEMKIYKTADKLADQISKHL
ncbi:hypothetical protein TrispH2_008815 [Trichoplax sp. H2]|nr:hypothetical protein TrispH2_008815 [Trichoplax sp. H2]|eukprot:RDD39136.1 hypothetical protein TrispH2_008815 [Trichoplax sp. H2]